MAAAELNLERFYFIYDQVENKIKYLSQPGCQCSAFNTQCRERTKAKDQQRIKNDIGNTADQKPDHRNLHLADTLEDLFVGKIYGVYDSKEKNNCRIADPEISYICIGSKQRQKTRHDKNTSDHQNNSVECRKHQAVCGCFAGSLPVSGTKTDGNL